MADLREAILLDADLSEANLQDASLTGTDFTSAALQHTQKLSVDLLCKAKTLYQARMDDGIREQVEKNFPHLLNQV